MGRGEVSSHRHAHKEADQGHSIIFKHNLTFLGQSEQDKEILWLLLLSLALEVWLKSS